MQRSVVEVEIDAPRGKVAELFADPRNSTKWMDDLERCEPLRGEMGMPGSRYRLVPKQGDGFVAMVLARDLPSMLKLRLESPGVDVSILAELHALPGERTKLVSKEDFRFRGIRKLLGFFARGAIHRVHRTHIEAFKRFAEAAT